MIKNQRQYNISKAQLEEFRGALSQSERIPLGTAADDAEFRKLEIDALRSQAETLDAEIREYEALVSGERTVIEVNSIADLPRALIQARIASGLSQKELGDRLGMKEQQIQRYEATDYESASLSRIAEVVKALGLNVREDILLPTAQVSLMAVWDRLKPVGLSRDFVEERLLPRELAARVQDAQQDADTGALALAVSSIVGRIFGFTPASFFGTSPLSLGRLPVQIARFKLPQRAKESFVGAYTVYAHYLALLVLAAARAERTHDLPQDWEDVRNTISTSYGDITFKNTLRYVWNLGVPVLPLQDKGTFHGACWRASGRSIVVLKQRNLSPARWLIDLLHELFHALDRPDESEFAVIEESEMSEARRNSDDEREATEFAGDVVLDGRAEELAELCAHLAGGSIPRLKGVVPKIARQEGVSVGVLANYMAFRLSTDGKDWWGAAQNLQEPGENPCCIARDLLVERLDFSRLNPIDRDLLSRAITELEDDHET
jgi:transcriptional regulator with XRE-family HTH domain